RLYERRLQEFCWINPEAVARAAVFLCARDGAADRSDSHHASDAACLSIWKSHSGLDPVACVNAAGSMGGQNICSAMEASGCGRGLVLPLSERALYSDGPRSPRAKILRTLLDRF